MTIFNCECKRDCLLFSAIASVIIGIIVAFYMVVLLTAWLAPVIVFLLIAAASIAGVGCMIKKR